MKLFDYQWDEWINKCMRYVCNGSQTIFGLCLVAQNFGYLYPKVISSDFGVSHYIPWVLFFLGGWFLFFFSLHSMCSSLFFYQPSMSFFHFFIYLSLSLARCDHSVILFDRDHRQQKQQQRQYAALIDFQHLCAGNCIEMFTRKEEKKKKNKTHNTNTNTHSHAYP